jgi:hypothetical protein
MAFLKRKGIKTETNIETISSLKDVIVSNRFNDIVIGFLDDYEIGNRPIAFDSFLEFKEYVYGQLNDLNPVIMRVNSNLLDYGPTNLQNSNRNHTLVVAGCSREMREIYFYDYFIPTYPPKTFYGSMNIDDFGEMTIKNGKFHVFHFDYLKLKESFGEYGREEFMSDLKNNIDAYMDNSGKMELLADTINNLLPRFSKEDILKNSRELVHHMMYRSIIPSRSLLKNICKKYNWLALYDGFDELALEWHKISLSLIKCSFAPTRENYGKISGRIFALLEKEKSIMGSMGMLE